jgi:hypothetical protein
MYKRYRVTTLAAAADIIAKDSMAARTKLQNDLRFGRDVWLDTTSVKAIEDLPGWKEPAYRHVFTGFQRTSTLQN